MSCSVSPEEEQPIAIGVLLPLSDAAPGDERKPIEWALENVNAAGGVAGRRIELVWVDLSRESLVEGARRLAANPRVVAVIGPDTSSALFEVAHLFVDAHKPLVSPSATAADVFRAFAGKKYVWRTVESDIAQIQTQLVIAKRDGARTVSLLGSQDPYGATFFNWVGFFSRELGLSVDRIESWDQATDRACLPHVSRVLSGAADVVIAVPSDPAMATCFSSALLGAKPRVLFSDMALRHGAVLADGSEGTIAISDPKSGFDLAYQAKYREPSPAYASRAYDAVTLLAYGLERSRGRGGEPLADAMAEVVDARGAKTSWDAAGIRDALGQIRRGTLPDLGGASGPFEFDRELHTDPVASTYGRFLVRNGVAEIAETLATSRTTSIYQSFASEARRREETFEGSAAVPARTGLRALIVATSKGFVSYRHQADALAVHHTLRTHGVAENRIALVLADDLARDPRNVEAGIVRNTIGGPNLNVATIDRRLDETRVESLRSLLEGLDGATEGDDVLVYAVGHGGARGLLWEGQGGGLLDADLLADVASTPHRRMLIVVEACQAGLLAKTIVERLIPRVLLLTSSDEAGGSVATHWDPKLRTWLADEMSFRLTLAAKSTSLLALFRDLYLKVPGSHVSVYNAPRFANLGEVPLADFVTP